MKILFIGGTGILSRDTVHYAVQCGYEVYLLNRGKRMQLADAVCNSLIADIRKPEEVARALGNQHFDVVIDYLSYTTEQLQNTLGIFNYRCEQFIFISSATVYEKTVENEVFSENKSKKGNERWIYASRKYACERLLEENYRATGQKYTIVRPYVTYGDTRFPYALIPQNEQWSLAKRLIEGKAIPMWGKGNNVCTLTHTRDFAIAMVGLMGNPKAYNEDFHITSGMEYSWREIVELTAKALGVQANIVEIPLDSLCQIVPEYAEILRGDKATNMRFDNRKIKDAVPSFDCKIDFKMGIRDTIAFYQSHPQLQVVNFRWDGRMDYLIAKAGFKDKNAGCPADAGWKDKVAYYEGRYPVIRKALGCLHQIKGKAK